MSLNVNKIFGLLRNGWRTTKWLIYDRLSLNVSFIFSQRRLKTSIWLPQEDNGIGAGRVVPTTLLKLWKSRQSILETMSIDGRNIHEIPEIKAFLDRNESEFHNQSFYMESIKWSSYIKKNMKNLQSKEIKQYQICEAVATQKYYN